MSRDEEIEKAATDLASQTGSYDIGSLVNFFVYGAKWADEHNLLKEDLERSNKAYRELVDGISLCEKHKLNIMNACIICLGADLINDGNKMMGIAEETLNQIMKLGTTGDGNTPECMLAYECLAKIAEMKK